MFVAGHSNHLGFSGRSRFGVVAITGGTCLLTFCVSVLQASSGGAVEVDVPVLVQASEAQLNSFPGNGHITNVIPDIHFADLIQLVLMEFDWGSVSYSRRTDTHTIALETATITFKTPPVATVDVLVKLDLTSSTSPAKTTSGGYRWAKLIAGTGQVDVVAAPDLKTTTVYSCPYYCSDMIEQGWSAPAKQNLPKKPN